MRSGYGQCVQDTVRRSLVFGPFNILIPYLQYMCASPSTTRGIDTMYDERRGLHDGVSAFKSGSCALTKISDRDTPD